MKRKRYIQTASIAALLLLFIVYNLWFYLTFTRRYQTGASEGRRAKSIELDRYLPFAEDTLIVRHKGSLQFSEQDLEEHAIPVIDGAAALYPVFSAFVYATYPERAVSFDGTDFTPSSCLQMNNTIAAYQAVADGDADIVLCAPPSEEQLAYARERGVTLVTEPVGREAFVFLVNENNPVDNLTIDEVRAIYSNEIRNWKEVGGSDKRIEALQRNAGSGSQTAFLKVMGDAEPKRPLIQLPGSAIGFSFRYYVEDVVAEGGVKMLSLNGFAPTKDNIAKGAYPIVSEFYAVYREDNPNPNVKCFVDWMRSEEGQRIVEDTGYIPLE